LVDVREPAEHSGLVEALQLRTLPQIVLADPDLKRVVAFDAPPSDQELARICFSPTRDLIVRTLLSGQKPMPVDGAEVMPVIDEPTTQPEADMADPAANLDPNAPAPPKWSEDDVAMVLLFVPGTDASAAESIRKVVHQASNQAKQYFKARVPVIELDPSDQREHYFLKQLGHATDKAEPTIAFIMGKGKALDVIAEPSKLGADLDLQLLDRVQVAFHDCGCTVQPRDLGRDLLMARTPEAFADLAAADEKVDAIVTPADSKQATASVGPAHEGIGPTDLASGEGAAESGDSNRSKLLWAGGAGVLLLIVGLFVWLRVQGNAARE
jgi:hypothetical protein